MSELGGMGQQATPPSKLYQNSPNIVRLIAGLINPAQAGSPAGRPPSRLNVFEDFLGNFVNSLGQGLAASGHGPGANARGAGAAIMAPQTQAMQQAQIASQQAEAQQAQQRAALEQAQTGQVGVETDLAKRRLQMMQQAGQGGYDPFSSLGNLSPDEQAVVSAAKQEAAVSGNFSAIPQAAEKIANMRAISGRAGQRETVADQNSPTGFSYVRRDRAGNVMGTDYNAPPPGSLVPKTSVTQKSNAGDTTTTTTTPNYGQKKSPQSSGGASRGGGGGTPNGTPGGPGNLAFNKELLKTWEPAINSAERFNVMAKNYEDGLNGDQQAMLSLLANHLGMTMSAQKGARLNQALIDEAMKSRPWLQGLESKIGKDGYLTGVTLSPEQMRQMLSLGRDKYIEDVKNARSGSTFLGGQKEPARQLSKEGAFFYRDLVGGDMGKAMTLARTDGWTF
jgi:hypothetical protein